MYTDIERARHREEVGRAAAAMVIFESVDGSDCRNREAIEQAVALRMSEEGDADTKTYVFVRVDDPEMFEPFRTDEFLEELAACASDEAEDVMVGIRAFADAFLLSPRSNRIH